jgi:hypothetical protein
MAPGELGDALVWLARNTKEVKELADSALSRQLLAAATSRLDGKRAAPTSVRRNRAVLVNALDYAVELKLLDANPVKGLKWRAPKVAHEVDRRVVVNPRPGAGTARGRPRTATQRGHASSPSSASSTTAGCGPKKLWASPPGCRAASTGLGRGQSPVARAR